jgi:hypothetical protein
MVLKNRQKNNWSYVARSRHDQGINGARLRAVSYMRPDGAMEHYPVLQQLVGFGRACAPVSCAHPSFWAHWHAKRGAARPPPLPITASLLLIHLPKIKNELFQFKEQNASHQARALAARGVYLSTGPPRLWNILFPASRPTPRTLQSYTAPYWAKLHSKELCCTILSYVYLLGYAKPY